MYLSLKWKAVIFLSLVLIVLTGTWVSQYIFKAIDTYENRVENMLLRQQVILNQLLDDNFLRLSQLSQLIAEMPAIQLATSETGTEPLQAYLETQWIKLNIDSSIDYIGLYSTEGKAIGSAFSQVLFQNRTLLSDAIAGAMQTEGPQTPRSFLFCDSGCSQFVIEPFVLNNGSEALILIGQNMADVIQRVQQVSGSDLALLLPLLNEDGNVLDNERLLERWDRRLWAASRYQDTVVQLQNAQQAGPFEHVGKSSAIDFNDQKLLLKALEFTEYPVRGNAPDLIVLSDETRHHENLVSTVKVSVLVGAIALLAAEVALILIMLGPLRRLFSVVEALDFLPRHQYGEARQKLQRNPSYLKDELSLLEQRTRFVTRELEELHIEVEDKNRSLQEQVSVVSRSQAFLARLIDSSHLFIVTLKPDGSFLTTNNRFNDEFSQPVKTFTDLLTSRESKDLFQEKIRNLQTSGPSVMRLDAQFSNNRGQTIYLDWTFSLVEDEQGKTVILASGIDLTQRKRDEEALEWLANNDPLTGIGNRRGFQHDLQTVLGTQKTAAVVFIDVNRFKQINDLYGHNIGDNVLIQIANTLRDSVRASDSISRLAGDEFTVLLPDVDYPKLEKLVQKLSKQLSGSIPLPGEKRVVEYSVSVGAALMPDHGTSEQELIVHADMAMYQAKKSGSGQWQIFDPANNDLADLRRDHALTSILKEALNRTDLFELYYQPILSIGDGTVCHYEVLLRLRDADGRAIYPNDFIPAAERMGLIRLIDEWVMDHAILSLAVNGQGADRFSLSINISAPTLQSGGFPDILLGLIEKHGVDPGLVIIELTETAYIENFKMVLTNLERISAAGVLVALDDFGVGFSSFTYLKKLPLNYVKLDGSYILDLQKHPDNQVFVESLTSMVDAFGMQTIAEFVEDAQTLSKLKELGVSYAQGYFIGKPAPNLAEMVAESHTDGANPGPAAQGVPFGSPSP